MLSHSIDTLQTSQWLLSLQVLGIEQAMASVSPPTTRVLVLRLAQSDERGLSDARNTVQSDHSGCVGLPHGVLDTSNLLKEVN